MTSIPRSPRWPHYKTLERDGWRVDLAAHVGLVRQRMEDAWRILPEARLEGRVALVAAVFDGLGGMPLGQEAAWAAADGLESVMAGTTGRQTVLGDLNQVVLPTGGCTTAVIACFPETSTSEGRILCVGDSAAYGLAADGPRLLVPKDATGPTSLTDYLGNPGLRGHDVPLGPSHGPILLCTDGVDGVVERGHLEDVLRAGHEEAPDVLARLLERVLERGAPDNATACLVQPPR